MRFARLARIDHNLLNKAGYVAAYFHIFEEDGERVDMLYGEPFADFVIGVKPGDDVKAVLVAQTEWLAGVNAAPIDEVETLKIERVAQKRHTPEVIEAYRKTQTAARMPEKTPAEKIARGDAMKLASNNLEKVLRDLKVA